MTYASGLDISEHDTTPSTTPDPKAALSSGKSETTLSVYWAMLKDGELHLHPKYVTITCVVSSLAALPLLIICFLKVFMSSDEVDKMNADQQSARYTLVSSIAAGILVLIVNRVVDIRNFMLERQGQSDADNFGDAENDDTDGDGDTCCQPGGCFWWIMRSMRLLWESMSRIAVVALIMYTCIDFESRVGFGNVGLFYAAIVLSFILLCLGFVETMYYIYHGIKQNRAIVRDAKEDIQSSSIISNGIKGVTEEGHVYYDV